ncbi:MAG TPA: hypothetical protein PLU16_07670 [Gallionellaceae bacterium]|jgi:hypothetical protein|nr:hypothetical protein [Gallionellaceae bacterium]HQS75072.1 hypothetical protein [Gallionellaceae bacterium]
MIESTITCPACKIEIRLTESPAAPLIESIRRQFEPQLVQKMTVLPLFACERELQ